MCKTFYKLLILVILVSFAQEKTQAAYDHRGGNGGDGIELDMMEKATQLAYYLESANGKSMFNDIISASEFRKKIKEVDFEIVTKDVYERHGQIRTCVNFPELNLIKCNSGKWLRETESTQYALLFHEILNLLGKELGTEADISRYPYSSRILTQTLLIRSYNVSEREYRPEFYALSREGYGKTYKNEVTKESMRLICLKENVPLARCNSFNIVLKYKKDQLPLEEDVIALDKSKIKTMLLRLEHEEFAKFILGISDNTSSSNFKEELSGFRNFFRGISNSEMDLTIFGSIVSYTKEEEDQNRYFRRKGQLKRLLLSSKVSGEIYFTRIEKNENGSMLIDKPQILINGDLHPIIKNNQSVLYTCQLAGFNKAGISSWNSARNLRDYMSKTYYDKWSKDESSLTFETDYDTKLITRMECYY